MLIWSTIDSVNLLIILVDYFCWLIFKLLCIFAVQLQGQCDQLKKRLDERSADNVKQKELVEQLSAECSELKEVRLLIYLL